MGISAISWAGLNFNFTLFFLFLNCYIQEIFSSTCHFLLVINILDFKS